MLSQFLVAPSLVLFDLYKLLPYIPTTLAVIDDDDRVVEAKIAVTKERSWRCLPSWPVCLSPCNPPSVRLLFPVALVHRLQLSVCTGKDAWIHIKIGQEAQGRERRGELYCRGLVHTMHKVATLDVARSPRIYEHTRLMEDLSQVSTSTRLV